MIIKKLEQIGGERLKAFETHSLSKAAQTFQQSHIKTSGLSSSRDLSE
jgi:hypothetical protein